MCRVLVVDDEKDVVDALERGLSRRGYEVEVAFTGTEAVLKVRKSKFDVILLDVVLPDLNGVEVLEQVKKIDPEIEAIMITGHASIETAINSMKKGAYDYVEKPVFIDKIVAVIEKAGEKHRLAETVALYEIGKAIFSTVKMDDLLKIIIDLGMRVLRADDASLMLFDESGKLYIAIASGLNEEIRKETKLDLGERISGWVAKNKEGVILINGLKNDPRFSDFAIRADIKSAMVIPLLKNDRVLGVLSVNRLNIEENFTNADMYKLNIYASLVSFALDNAALYKNVLKTQVELLRANQGLEEKEKKALDMLNDLRQAHEKLKVSQLLLSHSAKLADLGKLVSAMAHEVNNPLMIISGTAQLALMDENAAREQRQSLDVIVKECWKAKDIIQRLLKFSHPSAGELKEKDVNSCIESIISIIEHQFNLAGVQIKRNYGQNLPLVCLDEGQMQEVFMNLLNNAKDAMAQGGEITVSTYSNDEHLLIEFKDCGCGMSQEVIKSIFDPFFTTKEMGTGLGLSVCYGIVKAHQGDLKFESEIGKWTKAILVLPLRQSRISV
ncbi:MAG: response regulator [Candidatus Omnitrophica bacterium]|nr:response regulator [Candidatus Omnitrophota bacterium]